MSSKVYLFILIGWSLCLVSGCGNFNEIKRKKTAPSVGVQSQNQYNFAEIREKILEPKCMNCHDRHGAYQNYQVVKASAQSLLDRILTKNPQLVMPPLNYPQMTNEEIRMFEGWVLAGAPEKKSKDEAQPLPPRQISFKEVYDKVLRPNNCVACHSEYEDYETARKAAPDMVSLVANNKMPFPKRRMGAVEPVSAEGQSLLIEWVNQGSPEFSDRPVAPLLLPPLKPNWLSLRNQVFGPKCILCHNSYGPRGGKTKAFESYTKLRNWWSRNPDLFIVDENSEEYGEFVDSMIDSPSNYFFMPVNYDFDDLETFIPHVTDQEMAVIKLWVKNKLPYSETDQ